MILYDYTVDENGRLNSLSWPPLTDQTIELEQEPEHNLADYTVNEGSLVYDPLPAEEALLMVSAAEKLEAQVTYTAMMTDTLLQTEE